MRLLLVDDEFFVRERIAHKIDWQKLSIDDVRSSDNGMTALKTAQVFLPDILITDVRMPQMDGIKLAEAVKQINADCKIIFVSGYSDVPYLRSAIRLHAVNYVEKPIDMEELTASIQNAVNEIQKERIAQNGISLMEQNSQSELKKSLAAGLTQEEQLKEVLPLLEETFDLMRFSCFATAVVRLFAKNEEAAINEKEISTMLRQSFSEPLMQVIWLFRQDKLIIHLMCPTAEYRRKDKLEPFFMTLDNLLKDKGYQTAITIGPIVKTAEQLPISYQEALTAGTRCFFNRPGYVLFAGESAPKVFDMEQLSLSEYAHALRKDNDKTIISLVRNATTRLKQYDGTSSFEVTRFYYSVILMMVREANKLNIRLFDDFSDEFQLLDYVNQLRFIDDLNNFTISAIELFYNKVRTHVTGNSIVDRILYFVEQNYADPDLSITMISESMNLSSTYICHLFKDVIGKTLGNHITEVRIHKAMDLMERENCKIKEVAEKVGYRNGNYFSYKFKKMMGYSPSGDKL